MRCTSALAMLASRGYVFPLNETETTRNSMTTLSFMFSLRLRFVTVRLTVAPAGIATPFEPLTVSVVVAVAFSPAAFGLVQNLSGHGRLMVVAHATLSVGGGGELVPLGAFFVLFVAAALVLVG